MSAPLPDAVPDVRRLRRVWVAALGVFVLAGLTGVLYRWIVAFGWTPAQVYGLELGDVRHAHSHLMYFGWATPVLMALAIHHLEARTGRRVRGAGAVLGAVFGLALLAYVPFLLFGYAPASVGGARLPLSVMAAGANVLAWYAFAACYARARRRPVRAARPDPAVRVLDLAVGFLLLATMGAWGLPLLGPLGIENPALSAALTHVFLDVFSEGWFVLGVLGLAYAAAERAHPSARPASLTPAYVAAAGVPFTFALALPAAYVPAGWDVLARGGGVLVALGLLASVAVLARRLGGLWTVALGALALKAAGGLLVAAVPAVDWSGLAGLRVLYLHLMLLGFVSLGLVAAAGEALGTRRGAVATAWAVGLLLLSLVPLTPWWPAALAGRWAFLAAAAVAPAPVVGAVLLARAALRSAPARRPPSEPAPSRSHRCPPSSPTPRPPSASPTSPRPSRVPS